MLPNVRKLFIPDPGMTFFDIDLDSADLRIVAWESNCLGLKEMFHANLKPYVEAMKIFYDDPTLTKSHHSYPTFKAFAHATNYLGTPAGLSPKLGLSVRELERMQDWYFSLFPEIPLWQESVRASVNNRKYVENIFGYRIYYFDRIVSDTYNKAIAAIPQSTVACIINRGLRNLYERERRVQVLLQVHDSLAGQFPTELSSEMVPRIIEECSIELPYDEPMVIPVGIKTSEKSWGDC